MTYKHRCSAILRPLYKAKWASCQSNYDKPIIRTGSGHYCHAGHTRRGIHSRHNEGSRGFSSAREVFSDRWQWSSGACSVWLGIWCGALHQHSFTDSNHKSCSVGSRRVCLFVGIADVGYLQLLLFHLFSRKSEPFHVFTIVNCVSWKTIWGHYHRRKSELDGFLIGLGHVGNESLENNRLKLL